MVEERRTMQRLRAYRPLRLHQRNSPHIVETLTKDLAIGGLRCLSPILFPVSTEVSLELILSNSNEPLSARGRTMWFRTIPQSEQFDVGIAFLDLQSKDKRRLSAYLEYLFSQSAFVLA